MNQLTPQNLVGPLPDGAPILDKSQIQGDVLIGLQKNVERFLFFTIVDVAKFKDVLPLVATRITTTADVEAREFQLRDLKENGGDQILSLVGVNVGFTSEGMAKLKPGLDLGDTSFHNGARGQAKALNDPVDGDKPTGWVPEFFDASIDGVFLITGGEAGDVDDEGAKILQILGTSATVAYDEVGSVRPGAARGHEHFGWQDGISQPGIAGITTTPFPGQRTIDAGRFVFGYPTAPPVVADPAQPFMVNGSFMVFRRLKQFVPEFDKFLEDQSIVHDMDPVLLGARLVGRWKSGAPMATTPVQDDPFVARDAQQNNDFDFADDQAQRRCPFGAHIRKANPRADFVMGAFTQEKAVDPRRIVRAGIPYGPEVSAAERAAKATQLDRGLMFVCYQTSIKEQFEFVQTSWVNNENFIFNKTRPSGPNAGQAIKVGPDPIIGQAAGGGVRVMDEPEANYPSGSKRSTLTEPDAFVVPTAAGYFFVPSIRALAIDLAS